MEFDAFTAELGRAQGRLTLPDGEIRFVLGALEPRRFAELSVGDFAELSQMVDLTGVDFVRVMGEFRTPVTTPSGIGWELSVVVDGDKRGRVLGTVGKTRRVTDLVANVSKLQGVRLVAVRLELVRS